MVRARWATGIRPKRASVVTRWALRAYPDNLVSGLFSRDSRGYPDRLLTVLLGGDRLGGAELEGGHEGGVHLSGGDDGALELLVGRGTGVVHHDAPVAQAARGA